MEVLTKTHFPLAKYKQTYASLRALVSPLSLEGTHLYLEAAILNEETD